MISKALDRLKTQYFYIKSRGHGHTRAENECIVLIRNLEFSEINRELSKQGH